MREVALFGEDRAHQLVVGALLRRLAEEHRVEVSLVWRQAYGGHRRVKHELNDYLRALHRNREPLPDLVVVATDANCKGLNERMREVSNPNAQMPPTVLAIPDPHVERWLLLDGAAFKTVLGQGCRAPDRKCDRDRYKQRLVEAIQAAGVEPILGGIEYAEDIIRHLDIGRAARADTSFRRFVNALRNEVQRWQP